VYPKVWYLNIKNNAGNIIDLRGELDKLSGDNLIINSKFSYSENQDNYNLVYLDQNLDLVVNSILLNLN
jgi:hypothetical protein